MDYVHHYGSPLGGITVASDGKALVGLWFDGQKHYADALDTVREEATLPVFEEADAWLDAYFGGSVPNFTPPTNVRGSSFRRRVCRILLEIPYGETRTYGSIARQIAAERGLQRMSAQAVGSAVGRNPVSLIIPCHRVVGTSGSLTGYGGGIWRKVRLLELEGVDMSGLFVPKKGTAL